MNVNADIWLQIHQLFTWKATGDDWIHCTHALLPIKSISIVNFMEIVSIKIITPSIASSLYEFSFSYVDGFHQLLLVIEQLQDNLAKW